MRYLAPLCLLLACWSPDGYSVRDATLSVAADATPLPETGADVVFPVDHPAVPQDAPVEVAVVADAGAPDVVTVEVAAPPEDAGVDAPTDHPLDVGIGSQEVAVDAGVDAMPDAPATVVDVGSESSVDAVRDAGAIDTGEDVPIDTGVDAGAEVGVDVPWVPDIPEWVVQFCDAFNRFTPVCRACTNAGSAPGEFCAFCPATGACSPEVRLPDGTRTALAPCPGPLMLHGENRCPLPDGGL